MQNTDQIKNIGQLITDFKKQGLEPILVGGMALVILGSQRVTKDFDFLISNQHSDFEKLTETLYQHGFELISKFNEKREVIRTIDNPRIAAIRLKMDEPSSIFFFNKKTRLKIDILLDFPFPAKEVSRRSQTIKVRSYTFQIASPEDLMRMKEIAYQDRKLASDAQDIEFLRNILKKRKSST